MSSPRTCLPLSFLLGLLSLSCASQGAPAESEDAEVSECVPMCAERCDGSDDGCGGECEGCPFGSTCDGQFCSACDQPSQCGNSCEDCTISASNHACVLGQSCGCEMDQDCTGNERCLDNRCEPCDGESCVRSALYPADWTPAFELDANRFLHDFSYAGYRNSEVPIPETLAGPVQDVTLFGADPSGVNDSGAAIQQAINAAASAGGGIVELPAGEYRVDSRLVIDSSGILLRGAGSDSTRVYFTSYGAGLSDQGHLVFAGSISSSDETLLVSDGINRANYVEVADAGAFSIGDDVSISWVMTPEFLSEHGMSSYWSHSLNQRKSFFLRQVVEVDTRSTPNRIVIDVPLRYPALTRDAASIRKESGYLSEVGIEKLALSNAAPTIEDALVVNKLKLIQFDGVKDAWARDLRSYASPLGGGDCGRQGDVDRSCHIQSLGIEVKGSKRVTVRDLAFDRAQNIGSGGNGYFFVARFSHELLFEESRATRGRHGFITDGDFSSSGVVFRDNSSSGNKCSGSLVGKCNDEFHARFAIACLVENHEMSDGWLAGNRLNESSGAGHTTTQSVFWRPHGEQGVLYSWQFGQGYVIGADLLDVITTVGNPLAWLFGHTSIGTAPEDFVEHEGKGGVLVPPSLFADQLQRRMSTRTAN